MRLCLPTLDDRGREAVLPAYFGSAPYCTVVDSESDELEVVPHRHAHRAPGTCEAVAALSDLEVRAAVCLGLGRRAHGGLGRAGIDVYVADAGAVGEVVEALHSGRLPPLDAEDACGGGHQRHCG